MNRRDFLKVSATTILALLTVRIPGTSLLLKTESKSLRMAELAGRLYQGTDDGRILVSSDGGLLWHCTASLGSEFKITGLRNAGDRLVAGVGFSGREFELFSANGIVWRTIV